jgi:hypothetical protein
VFGVPRRVSIEERIKRLEENRKFAIDQAIKRVNAIYDARIDLLREKGIPEKRTGPLSLAQRVELGKDRYIFFRTRFYEYMGLPTEQARARAESDYKKYRGRYLEAMSV